MARGWRPLDETKPPKGEQLVVWDGLHVSVAIYHRDQFLAHSQGTPVLDLWDNACIIKGVTHWQPLPRAPS
jgi:hypothetical protein